MTSVSIAPRLPPSTTAPLRQRRPTPANPDAYIPGDRRLALARGSPIPDRVEGAALFADISGFTSLTEALARELGPQRGAEVLTGHIDRVFQVLIDVLSGFDGHVIYFSGDAITCWLDRADAVRATACALTMQRALRGEADITTPSGQHIELALKVAVAVGAARRFVVGDPDIQLMDVLAGRLIDELAAAERHARRNEVIAAASALARLGDSAIIDIRGGEDGTCYGVVSALTSVMEPAAPSTPSVAALPADIVRRWMLPDVHARLAVGHGEFLAELRPAYPLFLQFGGIDYDADDDAVAKLDAFVRLAQRVLAQYGGNLLQLTLGDKGAYLYAVFGSPLAHEDDGLRAAAAAIGLRDLERESVVEDIRIGIAHGRLRSGMYGHAERQTFTCLGDAVNVAARLMTAASPGEILVTDAVRSAAGDAFDWKSLPALVLKGKSEQIVASALLGMPRSATRRHVAEGPLVGRVAELARLETCLDAALAGTPRVVALVGAAGIGKSRLVAEFARRARERGAGVARGEAQSYVRQASYVAWREVWRTIFGLRDGNPKDEQVAQLMRELASIDPELVTRAPLLAGVLDLPLPANDLTASFDAKLRKASLETLLVQTLRAKAAVAPLVVVLEDCHWLDPLSRDLLDALVHGASRLPVLFLLAYRPGSDATKGVEVLAGFELVALDELDPGGCEEIIRARLLQTLGEDAQPSQALLALVASRAQGNPFYIEELFNYLASQHVDPRDERALQSLQLPDSLHSLILSRVDELAEAPRRVLKVASVIGREFRASMLPGIYPDLGARDSIGADLAALADADLVKGDGDNEDGYTFKHAITREVAYESMPFALRSELHERVGDYIEETEDDAIERHLDLLAHHYWHSENRDKKREYLGRAGVAAQNGYANASAIDYFERLVPLLSKGSRLDMLLKLGKVHELVGHWSRAQEADEEALAIAEDLDDGVRRAACQTALAEVVRKQGHYKEALDLLNRAARGFASFGEEIGVARVMHLVGTVWAQRGNYDKALDSYNKSLKIRERIGDKAGMASLLSNLGIVAEHRGDYAGAEDYHRRALALRESVGERWAIGNSMTNLGMIACLDKRYEEARDWFEKAMAINREVGDRWMVAVCHNNLGNACRGLRDFVAARVHYAESLRGCIEYDDKWTLAFLLEDIAMLAAVDGAGCAALQLVAAVDALRASIDAPRAPALAREIDAQLAAATADLNQGQQDECRARGNLLDVDKATALAMSLCEGA
jgi:class 3 adenylate cyclase/tetratricopeptide (TPR) repeat protein